jgi:hypothetical protein
VPHLSPTTLTSEGQRNVANSFFHLAIGGSGWLGVTRVFAAVDANGPPLGAE